MAQDSESRDLDKVIVRLPNGMRGQLKVAAETSNRSMNAEIVSRLENSFRERSESALRAIINVGLGVEKYVSPPHGRETGFSPSVKKVMKERLNSYVDALRDAAESTVSDEEFAEMSEMLDRYTKATAAKTKKKR